jgi:hypothetical protein
MAGAPLLSDSVSDAMVPSGESSGSDPVLVLLASPGGSPPPPSSQPPELAHAHATRSGAESPALSDSLAATGEALPSAASLAAEPARELESPVEHDDSPAQHRPTRSTSRLSFEGPKEGKSNKDVASAVPPKGAAAAPLPKSKLWVFADFFYDWILFRGLVALVFCLFVLVMVLLLLRLREPPLEVKYKLTRDSNFAGACQSVSGDDIRNGTFAGTVSLRQLRDDLLVHIHVTGQPLMCAQHVGMPLCYCVKRTDPLVDIGPVPGSEDDYEELYNMVIVGMTFNTQHNSQEEPFECDRAYWSYRFDSVRAQFQNAQGKVIRHWFNELDSDLVQYAVEVLYKLPSLCGATDAVAAMESRFGEVAPTAFTPSVLQLAQ